jgi:hypothetical protein
VLVLAPAAAFAQNNTSALAANIVMGGGGIETSTDATNAQRWYKTGAVAGRSYCAETSATANNPTSTTTDTTISVFRSDGTTLIASNDDFGADPSADAAAFGPSRVCWTHTVADGTAVRIRAQPFTAGTPLAFRVKVTDTSLQCPWYFTDASTSFLGFVIVRNNSGNSPTTVTITAYNATGGVQGTPATTVLAANDTAAFDLTQAPFGAATGSGSVTVSYGVAATAANTSTGGVSASVTSLSFSTGVGFDVSCTPRADYRN